MDEISLLEKYSKAAPRYTSYPTAPHFSDSFTSHDWREELTLGQTSNRGLSLYAHIPFCDTLCYFCGCNMIATNRYDRVENYLQTVKKEMANTAQIINAQKRRVVEQLHWGGGTPTFLQPEDIKRLATWMGEYFGDVKTKQFSENAEISCEIDPRELTFEHLQALRESGFNRVSFGVQDIDPKVQKAVNRIEPEAMVREVFGWAKKLGYLSINLDLMTGLPYQSVAGFDKTLDVVLDLRPNRFAVFAYAHLPLMIKHQTLIVEESLPDFRTRLELQILVRNRLTNAGYINIGMDHYALPDDELVIAQKEQTLWRNFQGYTTRKNCDILAFGVSAISQSENVYMQNIKKLNDYEENITKEGLAVLRGYKLTADDHIRRSAIARVMCHLVLDIKEFEKEWQINFNEYFAKALASLPPLVNDGLIEINQEQIIVRQKGLPFIRNIAMVFDVYLEKQIEIETRKGKQIHSFSKTI